MTRRTRALLGLLLTLVLIALGLHLLNRLEPYEEIVKHGPSPEARGNPYLAAEHFLRQQGLNVQRSDSLQVLRELPSPGQTLLLLGSRRQMTARQAERLMQWTAAGGHLLFVAERLWDEDKGKSGDLLLDLLNIQQYRSEDIAEFLDEDEDDAAEAEAEAEADSPEQPTQRYPHLTQLYLENEQAPAYIRFDTGYHLYDADNRAHAWANSGQATHLLQLYHGEGLISVLSDSWIWQNNRIGKFDHAWLLWYMTQDSAVTLVHRADHDNLLSLLLRHFAEALAALALLLLAGLWHLGLRQGPLQQPVSRQRRQLQEHLRASADFLLRHAGQPNLLARLQQDIQRRARHRHPGFERLSVAEQWQVLSRLSRQPSSFISQAMRPPTRQRLRSADFTRQVANLQTIRNAL